jgi:predicted RNA-binding protein associated with RNAse of E/G family
MERVTIERHKWPDLPHYEYDATHLGDDEHGSWFWAPPGNEVRRAGEVLFRTGHLSLYLLPVGKPWLVWFGADPEFDFDIYVDVGTVPVRTPGRITIVDLDLDVVRRRTGEVDVLDEDELVLPTTRYGYPPELVTHARDVAAEVVALMEARVEPFGTHAAHWLREATGS